MTNTLLDFSPIDELRLQGAITAAVQRVAAPMGIELLIIGAFARDLHLLHRFGIDTRRQTADIDFALAVADWETFEELKDRLAQSNEFKPASKAAQRLQHVSRIPIDLVPFGPVETKARTIAWPPRGETVMDVFGFREAMDAADEVLLPGADRCRLVSLPALALLKLMSWQDRHLRAPRKDAEDLQLILNYYLDAGNQDRLWNEFVEWTASDDFSYPMVGPRMLGRDLRRMLSREAIERVHALLTEQASADTPAKLPVEMNRHDPLAALRTLRALREGLMGQ